VEAKRNIVLLLHVQRTANLTQDTPRPAKLWLSVALETATVLCLTALTATNSVMWRLIGHWKRRRTRRRSNRLEYIISRLRVSLFANVPLFRRPITLRSGGLPLLSTVWNSQEQGPEDGG